MEVKQLWLQECVKQGTITLIKIAGKLNPADLMTKFHDLNGLLTVSDFFVKGSLWAPHQTEGLGRRGCVVRIGVSPRSLYSLCRSIFSEPCGDILRVRRHVGSRIPPQHRAGSRKFRYIFFLVRFSFHCFSFPSISFLELGASLSV